jgi:cobalt-zinc-cadmium efflux system protein
MGHDHDHGHATARAGRRHVGRLWAALAVLVGFAAVEVVAAFATGSLALLSDAGHMVTDVLGIAMALAAIHLADRASERRQRTFGLYRLEILAALANAVLLVGVGAYVVVEAVRRLNEPVEVLSGPMLVVALAGLAANVVAFLLLRQGAEESLNVKGAYLEVLSDLVGSVGVVLAAVVIATTGWEYADPLMGVAIGVFIVPRAIRLGLQAVRVLVQEAPAGMDLDAMQADLSGVPGVVDVHDLHVWTLTSEMDVATAHLMVSDGTDTHAVLDQARALLLERYQVSHATLQVEPDTHEGCDEVSW